MHLKEKEKGLAVLYTTSPSTLVAEKHWSPPIPVIGIGVPADFPSVTIVTRIVGIIFPTTSFPIHPHRSGRGRKVITLRRGRPVTCWVDHLGGAISTTRQSYYRDQKKNKPCHDNTPLIRLDSKGTSTDMKEIFITIYYTPYMKNCQL